MLLFKNSAKIRTDVERTAATTWAAAAAVEHKAMEQRALKAQPRLQSWRGPQLGGVELGTPIWDPISHSIPPLPRLPLYLHPYLIHSLPHTPRCFLPLPLNPSRKYYNLISFSSCPAKK